MYVCVYVCMCVYVCVVYTRKVILGNLNFLRQMSYPCNTVFDLNESTSSLMWFMAFFRMPEKI